MDVVKSVVCIRCPIGCVVNVYLEKGKATKTEGHSCPRGESYAIGEVTNPVRMFTSSVRVSGGGMLSVKTDRAVPKDEILHCAAALRGITVSPPVNIGDIVMENIAGSGVNLIATRNISSR